MIVKLSKMKKGAASFKEKIFKTMMDLVAKNFSKFLTYC